MEEIFVVGAARTPIGAFQGALAELPAPQLGGIAIRAALERARVPADAVDEAILGCVLAAGLGQAPARQAAHAGGLPRKVGAATVNKVCGSGLLAVIQGARAIRAGDAAIVVAGGMESMSRAPYLAPRVREGLRMGHAELIDSMIHDGLWDAYGGGHMGSCGELCARERQITRDEQDAYAAESYRRARAADERGAVAAELQPVEVARKKGPPSNVARDEAPGKGDPAKLPALRPAFDASGTITAGNASSLADGAAALVLADAAAVRARGLAPLARIAGWAGFAQAPEWFTTAPAGAVRALLAKVGWQAGAVDLWEINEAFAVVALANLRELELDPARVNVRGGAVALGHPIGASGARILVTLLAALAETGGRRGVATLCIGGGEALALAVERT